MKYDVKDPFWKEKMELVRKEVIPYQWEALHDRIPDAEPSYCIRNLRIAAAFTKLRREGMEIATHPTNQIMQFPEGSANRADGAVLPSVELLMQAVEAGTATQELLAKYRFYGFVFQDSDLYKWLEAASYSIQGSPDEGLEQQINEAIALIEAAAQPDGYVNSYYTINDLSKRFTNLRDHHELYCFGHLVEAAVAHYQATGLTSLLTIAENFAHCLLQHFGYGDGQLPGYPGHEIAEMALARLYESTGKREYLDLCGFFLKERGQEPKYFKLEHQDSQEVDTYHQAHLPVLHQQEATGHAVRALYLYSGMAAYARLEQDSSFTKACETLWNSVTRKKMYITGGVGGTCVGEAFSFDYDLPNDSAYAETCASIGLVFFARRMLSLCPRGEYADVMERAFYNGILSGVSLDGKRFFYVNPLEVNPEACEKDQRKAHVKATRQKWFGCACCPPNLSRLLSSLPEYALEAKDNTVFLYLYLGGQVEVELDGKKIQMEITSALPWDGEIQIEIHNLEAAAGQVALRIPGWSPSYTCQVDGVSGLRRGEEKDGFLYLPLSERTHSSITLQLSVEAQWYRANDLVAEDAGKIALMRGPMVYCLEEQDNGTKLHQIYVSAKGDAELAVQEELGNIPAIVWHGFREVGQAESHCGQNLELYYPAQTKTWIPQKLRFIPYYAWANRGIGEMRVWIGEYKG